MRNNNLSRKMTSSIVAIILLSVCLCITTFALILASVSVDDNIFNTGSVKLNLNDGQPVITDSEYLFEPGMRIKKDFFLENQSTCSVYYRLYFEDIQGDLADVLEITVTYGDTVLYSGKINDLSKDKVAAADDVLEIGDRRTLSLSFYYPPESGNEYKGKYLSFTLCADGVQTRNNPSKSF